MRSAIQQRPGALRPGSADGKSVRRTPADNGVKNVRGSGTTAFVLSGGGSLGAVQVGVLQALWDNGVRPDLLIGTSVGAVNAAHVAGHGFTEDGLADLARIWTGLRRSDVFPLHPVRALSAVGGWAPSLVSDAGLRGLLHRHLTFAELGAAPLEMRVVATDLVSGRGVVLGEGDALSAVMASAAIPALFPPVVREGRCLVDGGLADHGEVLASLSEEVDDIYVLPAGFACALAVPPRSPLGVAAQALTILIQQRLVAAVEHYDGHAHLHVVPGLCPLRVSAVDFSHSSALIARAHATTRRWLERGAADVEDPARFLSLHDHRSTSPGSVVHPLRAAR